MTTTPRLDTPPAPQSLESGRTFPKEAGLALPHSLPRQSLSAARLRKHADYQRAYAASRKRHSASMTWFLAPQSLPYPGAPFPEGPRVGITAGKVLGKAHDRNRIKRRIREALRLHVEALPRGCDLILHPRRIVLALDFAKLEAEIVRILHQARAEARKLPQEAPAL
jgi:ribonuclease P protein component